MVHFFWWHRSSLRCCERALRWPDCTSSPQMMLVGDRSVTQSVAIEYRLCNGTPPTVLSQQGFASCTEILTVFTLLASETLAVSAACTFDSRMTRKKTCHVHVSPVGCHPRRTCKTLGTSCTCSQALSLALVLPSEPVLHAD